MAKKTFTGKDRRLLKQAHSLLEAIQGRDAIAADPKPTQAISSRDLLFDGDESDTETLAGAAKALKDRVAFCLAAAPKVEVYTVFDDTFFDTPLRDLRYHVASVNYDWLSSSGQARIVAGGQGAQPYNATSGDAIYTVNYAGPTDGQVDLYFTTPASFGAGIYLGVIVRAADASHWIAGRLEYWTGGSYRIAVYETTGSTPTKIGFTSPGFGITANTSYRLNAVLDKANLTFTLYKELAAIGSVSKMLTSLQTNKGMGIWWNSGADTNDPGVVVTRLTKKS